MNFLIVRLGALGDIIHAVPAAAALRAAFPASRIDWLVDAKHRAIIDLVTVVDHAVVLERSSLSAWMDVAGRMRQVRYDAAIDLQGLLKSALLARASGAPRVLGFSIWHLREKTARPFYSETDRGPGSAEPDRSRARRSGEAFREGGSLGEGSLADHVIYKNLGLLSALGVNDRAIRFPLAQVQSMALAQVQDLLGGARPFVLINPGAAWPNKRWPPERFGEVAAFLRDVRGLPSFVLWGPGEEGLAGAVVEASSGAARIAPPTGLRDLLALSRAASLMISGDTGPLHIAAAAGTPTVSLFGPTDPHRNGPWSSEDVAISRFGACGCHYERRCRRESWCLASIEMAEVTAAIQQRLSTGVRFELQRGGE
jgi:lipopolysaccharide heptosyltransferase I